MNVKELIKELKKFKGDLPVAVMDNEIGEFEVSEVGLGFVTLGNAHYFNVDVEPKDDIVMLY